MHWKFIAPVAIVCVAQPALAWNNRGHMLSAMIAYAELKPEVREKVNAILKAHPQRDLLARGGPAEGPDLELWIFANAACWPDMLRGKDNPLSAAEHHGPWHYVNYPVSLDGVAGPAPVETWDGKSDPFNIIQAFAKTRASVASSTTTPDRRAIDLCWVEHLVGDIHQPLHSSALFSKQFPEGDRGSDMFAVKRGSAPMNLHAYWDNALGSGTDLASLKTQMESLKNNPELTRAKLCGEKPETSFSAWAHDSLKLAEDSVYRKSALKGAYYTTGDYSPDTPALPADYEAAAKQVAAKQIMLAGYRMADVLNEALLGGSRATPAP